MSRSRGPSPAAIRFEPEYLAARCVTRRSPATRDGYPAHDTGRTQLTRIGRVIVDRLRSVRVSPSRVRSRRPGREARRDGGGGRTRTTAAFARRGPVHVEQRDAVVERWAVSPLLVYQRCQRGADCEQPPWRLIHCQSVRGWVFFRPRLYVTIPNMPRRGAAVFSEDNGSTEILKWRYALGGVLNRGRSLPLSLDV